MSEKPTVEALQQKIAALEQQLHMSRQNELSSQVSEEKWRAILHNVPNHLILFDLQGKVLFVNRVAPNLGTYLLSIHNPNVIKLRRMPLAGRRIWGFLEGSLSKWASNAWWQ